MTRSMNRSGNQSNIVHPSNVQSNHVKMEIKEVGWEDVGSLHVADNRD
jgi:hypothetical protein